LWPENFSKDDKFAFRNVEQKQWPSIYFYKWDSKKSAKNPQLTQERML
jgi:hypothetical protein